MIVKEQGTIFRGGPPLVKAATGEVVSAEELGGAEVHTRTSGVADHYAENDTHALAIARRIVASLNSPKSTVLELRAPQEPRYDPAELYGLLRRDLHQPYGVREVMARLVEVSALEEFKAPYGPALLCGFAQERKGTRL